MIETVKRARVVIVGAGFAGLTVARRLRWTAVNVILVDRNNYHLFTPLVYQVASALLDPSEVAQPVRRQIRSARNCDFLRATVTGLDLAERQVLTDHGTLEYDYLVVAAGSENNYFGNDSIRLRSLSVKDLPDAIAIRNWVLDLFERWRWTRSPEARRTMLTFAVIGGGPTGVEYAGALSELIRLSLRRDFGGQSLEDARVVLMEGSGRLLGIFDERLSAAALRSLEKKGVEVWADAMVAEVSPREVRLKDGRSLKVGAVVWAAGVRASPVASMLGVELSRQGRVPVTPTLQLESHPEVFVIGDMADANNLPMLAQPAMQEAKHAARGIHNLLTGRPLQPFRYRDLGTMATIGRNSAIAQIGPLRLSGFLGWLLWLFVHLLNIVTLRARLAAMINWAWDYVFMDRPVRLLLRAAPTPIEEGEWNPETAGDASSGVGATTAMDSARTSSKSLLES
ncbi:MAG: NAD(P)/FAD-dependent oxidoreductase [Candidatus Dormibacteraeota bacterium]|nr:NAD(P)/FAD-dependent oxidoreductase [Candidatus Dormibacteraeota bacterium]